jgi:chemotaxis protein CheD
MPSMAADPAVFRPRQVVGVGDLAIGADPSGVLSTYSLGSCIAVAAFDSVRHVGGLLHFMLPESQIAKDKALRQPALFADTGLPMLIDALCSAGAQRQSLRFLIAGGASVIAGTDPFRIGERNTGAALDFLRQSGLEVAHTVVGGGVNRAVHLELSDGVVTVTTPNEGITFTL